MLVNNAGVMPLSPLDKLKVDEWDRTIDVNIKGVLYGIAAVLPRMKAQGSGHIVNVASIAGLKVFTPIGTVYSATKHRGARDLGRPARRGRQQRRARDHRVARRGRVGAASSAAATPRARPA